MKVLLGISTNNSGSTVIKSELCTIITYDTKSGAVHHYTGEQLMNSKSKVDNIVGLDLETARKYKRFNFKGLETYMARTITGLKYTNTVVKYDGKYYYVKPWLYGRLVKYDYNEMVHKILHGDKFTNAMLAGNGGIEMRYIAQGVQ